MKIEYIDSKLPAVAEALGGTLNPDQRLVETQVAADLRLQVLFSVDSPRVQVFLLTPNQELRGSAQFNTEDITILTNPQKGTIWFVQNGLTGISHSLEVSREGSITETTRLQTPI